MVVDLRFTGRHPHIIAQIVNAVAEEYINMTMEAKIENGKTGTEIDFAEIDDAFAY